MQGGRERESETHLVACPARRPAGAERGDRVAERISTWPALRQGGSGSGGGGGTGRSLGLGLARLIYVLSSRCSLVFLSLPRLLSSRLLVSVFFSLPLTPERWVGSREREGAAGGYTRLVGPARSDTYGGEERGASGYSWGPPERDRGPCADRELAMRAMRAVRWMHRNCPEA